MKRLLVDMDNCITDGNILDLINEFLGTNYTLDSQKDFYLQNLIKDRKEEFWQFAKNRNFYENCDLKEDCYEVLEKLNNIYDIYIVTSYLWDGHIDTSGDNLRNKYYYLKEKLPFIKPNKYIFTTNKNIITGDIAIDDRINNLLHTDKKLLFDAWHNRDIDSKTLSEKGIVRVYSWIDVLKELGGDD